MKVSGHVCTSTEMVWGAHPHFINHVQNEIDTLHMQISTNVGLAAVGCLSGTFPKVHQRAACNPFGVAVGDMRCFSLRGLVSCLFRYGRCD